VLVTPPEIHLDQYYASLRDHRELTPAERYGEALVQMQHGHAATAVQTLRELQSTYPQMTMLYAALGQALAAAGQMDASLALFERSVRLFPRNVPLTVRYSETLMQTGRPKQAHELLPSPPPISPVCSAPDFAPASTKCAAGCANSSNQATAGRAAVSSVLIAAVQYRRRPSCYTRAPCRAEGMPQLHNSPRQSTFSSLVPARCCC
jgi:predicted Zn-dependent protease